MSVNGSHARFTPRSGFTTNLQTTSDSIYTLCDTYLEELLGSYSDLSDLI